MVVFILKSVELGELNIMRYENPLHDLVFIVKLQKAFRMCRVGVCKKFRQRSGLGWGGDCCVG